MKVFYTVNMRICVSLFTTNLRFNQLVTVVVRYYLQLADWNTHSDGGAYPQAQKEELS
jgi:hypothetical protein